jgi:hypothetical protein
MQSLGLADIAEPGQRVNSANQYWREAASPVCRKIVFSK